MLEPRPRRPWLQAGVYALLGSTALLLAAATPRPGDPSALAAASAFAEPQQDPTIPPRLRDPQELKSIITQAYPSGLRARGIEGQALVSIRVSPVGNVMEARIKSSSGEAAFDAAALRVARQTRFVPGRTRGKVATAWVDLPIVFSISSGLTAEQRAERAKAEAEGEVRRMRASNVRVGTAVHEEHERTPFTDPPILANREEVRGVTERFYPPLLKNAGIGGTALVRVLIDETGQVVKIQLVSGSGHRALDDAAMRIAELMQFEPARNRDQRVNVWVTVPVTFTPPTAARELAKETVVDVAAAPTFTPFTVAPTLENAEDVTKLLQAFYPPLLRNAGIAGSPRVWFFIDETGQVLKVQIKESSGHEALDEAALRVAKKMQFTPAMNRQQKVRVWVDMPIVFK